MFRPVELVRINLHVLDTQVSDVSWALAGLGLLHLVDVRRVTPSQETLSIGDEKNLEHAYRSIKDRSKRLMEFLSLPYEPWGLDIDVHPKKDLPVLEREIGELEQTIPPLLDLQKQLTEADREKIWQAGVLRALVNSGADLVTLRRSRRLVVHPGIIATQNLRALEASFSMLPHVFVQLGEFENENEGVLVAFLPRDRDKAEQALDAAGFQKLPLPDRDAEELLHEIEKEQTQAREQLENIKETLQQTAMKAHRTLSVHRRKSEMTLTLLEAQRHFRRIGHTSLISGWVPRDKAATVASNVMTATSGTAYIEILDPDELREVRQGTLTIPILLSNPLLFRPFEKLTTAYGIPHYYEVEPTAFLAVSFLLMFGVMFGDVGQGLVLAGAGYGIFRTISRHTDLGILLMECGISSALFGVLYGSVFGLEDLMPPLWFNPMHNVLASLTLSLSFGAVLITLGLFFNVINHLRTQELNTAIFGERGLMGAFIYWVCLATGSRFLVTGEIGMEGRWFFLLVGLPALSILFYRPVEKIFRQRQAERFQFRGMPFLLVESLVDLGDTFLAYLANTVSFVRISAFALAHVGLFTAVFSLAETFSELRGGGLWYWLTLFVGNVFIIFLEGLVASIQAIRLEYYEFFSKFFKGGGVVFRPLEV